MKIEKVLCMGSQAVLVKEPFSEQLAALFLLAKLRGGNIPAKDRRIQIFRLSFKKALPDGVLRDVKTAENVKILRSGDHDLYLICEGQVMIDLLSGFPDTELDIREVPAAEFFRFLQKRPDGKNVKLVQRDEN